MKRAVLFIAGFSRYRDEPDFSSLIKALISHQESYRVEENGRASIEGLDGLSLRATRIRDSARREYDLFEADWEKHKVFLSKQSSTQKLIRGLGVIYFWLFSGAWREVLKSKYMIFLSLVTSVIFVFWYYSVFAIFVAALPPEWSIFGVRIPPDRVALVKSYLTIVEAWQLYAALAALLAFFPLNMFIDTLYFTRLYLQSEATRHRLRSVASDALWSLLAANRYSKVTIVAHSLGVSLAMDLLAGFERQGKRVRLITMGGQVGVLGGAAPWLRREAQVCAKNDFISEWYDYTSKYDFFSSNVPIKRPVMDFHSENLVQRQSMGRMLGGESHYMYFERSSVIEKIME